MKNLEIDQLNLSSMSLSEMRDTDGGLILLNLRLLESIAELAKIAVGEVVDFGQGVYDGFTHFVK